MLWRGHEPSAMAKWKPYSRSAAPPSIAKFTCHVPADRPAAKAAIESTAGKGRPTHPVVQQIGGGQADVR
jgi:hypothetical protein